MADALMLQISLCNTAVGVGAILGLETPRGPATERPVRSICCSQDLVAARKADLEAQRSRRVALEAQLDAESAEKARLTLELAEAAEQHASLELEVVRNEVALAAARKAAQAEPPLRGLLQERRGVDARLASLRALAGAESGRASTFSGAMDAWVEGLGAPARAIEGDISEMEARTRALEEQHEKERLGARPRELGEELARLEARRARLQSDLDAARAANAAARAKAEAEAARVAAEAAAAEAARAERQQEVFAAARQQRVNDARLKQLRRDVAQLREQKQQLKEAVARAAGAAGAVPAAAAGAYGGGVPANGGPQFGMGQAPAWQQASHYRARDEQLLMSAEVWVRETQRLHRTFICPKGRRSSIILYTLRMPSERALALQAELQRLKAAHAQLRIRKAPPGAPGAPFPITLDAQIAAPPGTRVDVEHLDVRLALSAELLLAPPPPGAAAVAVAGEPPLPAALATEIAARLHAAWAAAAAAGPGFGLSEVLSTAARQFSALVGALPEFLEAYEGVDDAGATVRRFALISPAAALAIEPSPAPALGGSGGGGGGDGGGAPPRAAAAGATAPAAAGRGAPSSAPPLRRPVVPRPPVLPPTRRASPGGGGGGEAWQLELQWLSARFGAAEGLVCAAAAAAAGGCAPLRSAVKWLEGYAASAAAEEPPGAAAGGGGGSARAAVDEEAWDSVAGGGGGSGGGGSGASGSGDGSGDDESGSSYTGSSDDGEGSSGGGDGEGAGEGGAEAPAAGAAGAAQAGQQHGGGAAFGISLEGLQLDSIDALELLGAGLQLSCARCGAAAAAALAPGGGAAARAWEWRGACGKCAAPMWALLRPKVVHESNNEAAALKVDGCAPLDLLPSLFGAQCGDCAASVALRGVQVGLPSSRACTHCHKPLTLLVPAVAFIPKRPPPPGAAGRARGGPRAAGERRAGGGGGGGGGDGQAAVVTGQPLPFLGTCKHYRHSHRWLRFPCCGQRFACDICHEEGTDGHEMAWAKRMTCGYCSAEQAVAEQCSACGKRVASTASHPAGRNTRFWEGGQGCRDSSAMSRKDPHRFRNSKAKTRSAKSKRVGPKPWS
ncbi:MAG: hypothetical protein J3K34DRAFT_459970 [Monoraphidium minutum]|nr:MAG: hypothetical protein J3K34DRAFT_459970 [Monoraphidium minutum]